MSLLSADIESIEPAVPSGSGTAPSWARSPLMLAGALAAVQGAVTVVLAALLIWSPGTVADLDARPETQYSGFGTVLLVFGALQLYGAYRAVGRSGSGRAITIGCAGFIVVLATLGLSGEGEVFRWVGLAAFSSIAAAWAYRRFEEHSTLAGRRRELALVAAAVAFAVLVWLGRGWRVFQVSGFVVAALGLAVVAGFLVRRRVALAAPMVPLATAGAAALTFLLVMLVAADATATQLIGVGWSALVCALAFVGRARADEARGGGMDDGWRVAIWFLLPSILGFFLFFLLPTIRAISISFQDFPLLENEGEWIGFDNYRNVLGDDLFTNAIWVTFKYVVINIGTQTVLALAIAVMMDRLTKSVFVRGVLLLPWLLPNVMVGLLWLFMLDPTNGIVNEWLGYFGIDSIGFLSNPDWAIPSLAFINTWKFTGYTALLLFAGMQTVPRNLYEAGALDGASEWKMFTTITLPLLRPVLVLVMVISLIGSFQVFDVVAAAGGGLGGSPGDPLNSTRVLYLYIYDKAFVDSFGRRAGQGAAAATLLMLGLLVITLIQLRLSRAGESDLA